MGSKVGLRRLLVVALTNRITFISIDGLIIIAICALYFDRL